MAEIIINYPSLFPFNSQHITVFATITQLLLVRDARSKDSGSYVTDSSAGGNEYRTLRQKYLMLEDESFALERELSDVEDEVKTLEDVKIALLDQLVVME
ncbi:unnamed protein product [Lupinus luteus]|uniref:Uncharacterized protein n=1 Tax=Lupinus luteus TaxID=3873 RepID=A0AAV1XWX3_LUPLU